MANLREHLPKVNLAQPNYNAPWAKVNATGPGNAYRIGLIYHLSGAENGGQHNVFVDVIGSDGQLISGLQMGHNWEDNHGSAPAPTPMDKRPPEPSVNFPIFAGSINQAWIVGSMPSDVVTGLRVAGYPELDTEAASGNYPGHNSYYLVFVATDAGHQEPPPAPGPVEPPTPPAPAGGDLGARVAGLEVANADLNHRLDLLEQFLGWKG